MRRVENWFIFRKYSKLQESIEITCGNNAIRKDTPETLKLPVVRKKELGSSAKTKEYRYRSVGPVRNWKMIVNTIY